VARPHPLRVLISGGQIMAAASRFLLPLLAVTPMLAGCISISSRPAETAARTSERTTERVAYRDRAAVADTTARTAPAPPSEAEIARAISVAQAVMAAMPGRPGETADQARRRTEAMRNGLPSAEVLSGMIGTMARAASSAQAADTSPAAAATVESLRGRWTASLDNNSTAEIDITATQNGALTGSFAGSPIQNGRATVRAGVVSFTATTTSAAGQQVHTGRKVGSVISGSTLSVAENTLTTWEARPK
jgi:hypothetical protein